VPRYSLGKASAGGHGAASLSEADDTSFCKNMLFYDGFENYVAMFAFNAYKCSIGNRRKINNLETEK